MSADFNKESNGNVFLARDHYGPDAEAIVDVFARKKIIVTGSVAEVLTAFSYENRRRKEQYTAAYQISVPEEMLI